MLAYLRPVDGVLNAWVRSVAGGDDRVVTKDSYRGIRQFFWAEDSKTLLYLQDDGGAAPARKEMRLRLRRGHVRGDGVAATPRLRRGYSEEMESRRRRGCDVDMSEEMESLRCRGCDVDIPWRCAPPRTVVAERTGVAAFRPGDENFHLFAIDATTPGAEARDLTPCPGAKAQNIITNKRFPGELLVAINERDKAQFDMYRCDLATGKLTLDTENPGGVVGWGSEDESFEVLSPRGYSRTGRGAAAAATWIFGRNRVDVQVREGIVVNPDSSKTVKVRADKTSDWRDLATFPYVRGAGWSSRAGRGGAAAAARTCRVR